MQNVSPAPEVIRIREWGNSTVLAYYFIGRIMLHSAGFPTADCRVNLKLLHNRLSVGSSVIRTLEYFISIL